MAEYRLMHIVDRVCREDWYWGDIDREVASQLLADKEHGSFLVRKSTSGAERGQQGCNYTLVVKKNDVVRNIRIHQGRGETCGIIADRCDFADVCELVQHYSSHPDDLHEHFPGIDLWYPVCKVQSGSESASVLLHRLVDMNKELINIQNDHNLLLRRAKELQKEIEQSRTTVASLVVVTSLFEEQLTTLQTMATGCGLGLMRPAAEMQAGREDDITEQSLSVNRAALHQRLETVGQRLRQAQSQHQRQEDELQRVRQETEDIRPQLTIKSKEKAQLRMYVEEKGMDKDYLDLLLKEDKQIDQSHYDDPANWWVDCNREEAENLHLSERIPGTFLVRPTQKKGSQAISIVCYDDDGAIVTRHCLIYHDTDLNQYGFHQEFCIFASVKELVKKHQTLSLKFYNKQLDVCLTYPVNYHNVGEAPPVPHRRQRRETLGSLSQEKRSS